MQHLAGLMHCAGVGNKIGPRMPQFERSFGVAAHGSHVNSRGAKNGHRPRHVPRGGHEQHAPKRMRLEDRFGEERALYRIGAIGTCTMASRGTPTSTRNSKISSDVTAPIALFGRAGPPTATITGALPAWNNRAAYQ